MRDLHELPKLADSLTYLYAEHVIVEQKAKAIELFDKDGATLVPTAALSVLLLAGDAHHPRCRQGTGG